MSKILVDNDGNLEGDLENTFYFVEILLNMNGMTLQARHNWVSRSVSVLKVLLLYAFVFFDICAFQGLIHHIFVLRYVLMWLAMIVSHHYFSVISDDIKSLLSCALCNCTREQRKIIKRFGFGLLVFWLVSVILGAILFVLIWITDGPLCYIKFHYGFELANPTIFKPLTMLQMLTSMWFAYGWFFATIFVYTFSVLCMWEMTKNFFYGRSASSVLYLQDMSDNNMHSLVRAWRETRGLKIKIYRKLGLFPFMWFAGLFIDTTLRLVQQAKGSPDDISPESPSTYFTINWVHYGIKVAFVSAAVMIFDRIAIRESEMINEMTTAITTAGLKQNSFKVCILIEDLNRAPLVIPHAWDMFDLRKSTILRFCSAVLPLSVMAVNLSQQDANVRFF